MPQATCSRWLPLTHSHSMRLSDRKWWRATKASSRASRLRQVASRCKWMDRVANSQEPIQGPTPTSLECKTLMIKSFRKYHKMFRVVWQHRPELQGLGASRSSTFFVSQTMQTLPGHSTLISLRAWPVDSATLPTETTPRKKGTTSSWRTSRTTTAC